MFAQALSSSPNATACTQTPGSSGRFGEVLTQQMGGGAKVDPADEEAALRELFHLLALLTTGRVDGSAFTQHDAALGAQAGPTRTEVETLKRIIRRLMRGGQPEDSDPANPGTQASEPSLSALIQSLPAEVQNLLRRAFPGADQLMAAETRRLLKGLNP